MQGVLLRSIPQPSKLTKVLPFRRWTCSFPSAWVCPPDLLWKMSLKINERLPCGRMAGYRAVCATSQAPVLFLLEMMVFSKKMPGKGGTWKKPPYELCDIMLTLTSCPGHFPASTCQIGRNILTWPMQVLWVFANICQLLWRWKALWGTKCVNDQL